MKLLALDGIYPNKENIRNESYPIVANLFAVYRKNEDNSNVRKLVEWILSDEGQKIVEESGYVALE